MAEENNIYLYGFDKNLNRNVEVPLSTLTYGVIDNVLQGQAVQQGSSYPFKLGEVPVNFVQYDKGRMYFKGVFNNISKISPGIINEDFAVEESGILNDFTNWTSENLGSGTSSKGVRLAKVAVGNTAGTARIYTTVPVNGDFWDKDNSQIEINWSVYIDDGWGTDSHNNQGLLLFGSGATPSVSDVGIISEERFGFQIQNPSGDIRIIAIVHDGGTLRLSGAVSVSTGTKHILRAVADSRTESVKFWIDDKFIAERDLNMSGTATNSYLMISTASPTTNRDSELVVSQISYIFTY